jgi:hypothetical protein
MKYTLWAMKQDDATPTAMDGVPQTEAVERVVLPEAITIPVVK